MANRHRRKIEGQQGRNGTLPPAKQTVTQYVERRLADLASYLTGGLEQLMFQQGQMMTTQAATLEWLDQHFGKPGVVPSDQIGAIVSQNIARAKAERVEREKAEAIRKLGQDEPREEASPVPPAVIAPEPPVDAPADTNGTS